MSEMIWMPHRLERDYVGSRLRYAWLLLTQRRRGVVMTRHDKMFLGYALTFAFFALLLAAFLLLSVRANAQDVDSSWTLRPLAQQCLDDPRCRSSLRRPRHHRYHPSYGYGVPEYAPRVYAYARRRDGEETRRTLACKPLMEGRGAEANTSEGALRLANRAWQAAVRSELGERHMDLKNAGDYRWTCFRSSTNESVAGRALEWAAGAVRMRCKVWARPCLAPIIQGLPDKGTVRQELEEEDALPGANRPPAQLERR